MTLGRSLALVFVCSLVLLAGGCTAPQGHGDAAAAAQPVDPATRVHCTPDSDPQAIEIAQSVMQHMGGWEAWDRTRYLKWRFFGRRLHYWDRYSGDIRIEGPFGRGDDARNLTILMNIDTKQGRAWQDGVELAGDELAAALESGHQAWVNDAYWMVMPYKLLDPGVTLKYVGERAMEDGRIADVLGLTFHDVGYTPQNRYEVFVARDTGLVEQWSFFADASDAEPGFTLPWTDWEKFGEIMLSKSRGRDADWEIAVYDDLPATIFTDPAPVQLPGSGTQEAQGT